MINRFHPFTHSHRTKILAFSEGAVANGLHAGRNVHGNYPGIAERAVANGRHTGRNLCANHPTAPKSAGANIGNAISDNDFPDFVAVAIPRLLPLATVIGHSPLSGNGQRACLRQIPCKPSFQRSASNGYIGLRIIRRHISFRVTGNIMTGICHHLISRHCPSPMDFPFVVTYADVSFGKRYAHIAYFKYDYGMGVIIHPQNIPDFYILI